LLWDTGVPESAVNDLSFPKIQSGGFRAVEPVTWFWENRIARRKVNVFFGPPETGKSNLGLYFVAKSTRGNSWPVDGHAPQGKWIVLSAEDDWSDTIVPRLVANGADLTQVHRLKMTHIGLI
jgi:hypothetical protein